MVVWYLDEGRNDAIGSDSIKRGGSCRQRRTPHDLETYRSFKLDRATSVADGIPPTNHDDIADTASSYCNAYADSMERDAKAFRQIGITLAEADAMAAASIESIS